MVFGMNCKPTLFYHFQIEQQILICFLSLAVAKFLQNEQHVLHNRFEKSALFVVSMHAAGRKRSVSMSSFHFITASLIKINIFWQHRPAQIYFRVQILEQLSDLSKEFLSKLLKEV
jgi:hypothetical protein